MGAGKTTVAEALATRLGSPISDSDDEIQQLTGLSGAEVAHHFGVPALHRLEAAVLIAALARPKRQIITAAASVVEDELVRRLLGPVTVTRIDVDVEVAHRRHEADDHRRPMSIDELQQLADRRYPLFEEVEDLKVDGTADPELAAAQIVAHRDHQI